MTVKQILSELTPEDMLRMNEKELRQVTNTLISAANKRLKRNQAAGRSAFAQQNTSKFTLKGKSFSQARAEFTRAYKYLNSRTSTAAGYKSMIRQAEERFTELSGLTPDQMTKEEIERFYGAINRFRELYPDKSFKYDSKVLAQMVIEGASDDDINQMMLETMQENYEKMMEEDMFGGEEYGEWEDFYSF